MEDLQLAQENVLASIYSIIGFEVLPNFNLDISKLLKECSLTCLRFEDMPSSPVKYA